MKIQLTDNAFQYIEINPEFRLPLNANECFRGLHYNDVWTPDITEDIADVGSIIDNIKGELNKQIREKTPECVSILPSESLYPFIIDNIHITLITREDAKNETHIPVRNSFKYIATLSDEMSYESTVVSSPEDENLLGLYQPKTGTIFLWIDKIIEHKIITSPELIFQTVLLHEMIHAFLDIHPRIYYQHSHGIRILSSIGKPTQRDSEETLDNTLVLRAYSRHPKDFDKVHAFIEKQPPVYKKAINLYNDGDCNELLKQHLADKISGEQLSEQKDLFFDVIYTDPDENDHKPQSTFSKDNFSNYIESLRWHIEELFGSFIYSFEDNINGCSCHRFLMESNWFKHNYSSPWLVLTYNDSTKDVLLQIGNTFYIRYDYNEIKSCYKRMPDGTVKKIGSDYPDIDPTNNAESLVQDLVIDEGLLPDHFGFGIE